MKCILCPEQAERCHIRSRGSGGTDDDWNIVAMCRRHHQEQHKIGWVTFFNSYTRIKAILKIKGWYIDEYTGKLWNDKLSKP